MVCQEFYKWGSLSAVVLQNTAFLLVACYSRHEEGPAYLGSVAVLLTELLKAAISLLGALYDSGPVAFFPALHEYLVRDYMWTFTFAVPALAYNVHNNLWYVAVANLDPVTIAVTTQLKIVFAALFAFLLTGQRLSGLRIASIIVLIAGLALLQSHEPHTFARSSLSPHSHLAAGSQRVGQRHQAHPARPEPDAMRGLLAMVAVCALSGFAGAFTERLLKDQSRASSLWIRNVQMSFFALPMAALTIALTDRQVVLVHGAMGLFRGFNRWIGITVILGALGGIMVSVVFKYAGNILKSFAGGISLEQLRLSLRVARPPHMCHTRATRVSHVCLA